MPKISSLSGFLSARGIRQADRTRHDVRAFFIFFLCGAVVWIFVLSIASSRSGGSFSTTLGTLGMFSAAAMISGGVLGFLFGIPRVLASSVAAAAQNSAFSPILTWNKYPIG
jgi:TRAP-type mannitol/chloroaromatic compound transport system permease small subunit